MVLNNFLHVVLESFSQVFVVYSICCFIPLLLEAQWLNALMTTLRIVRSGANFWYLEDAGTTLADSIVINIENRGFVPWKLLRRARCRRELTSFRYLHNYRLLDNLCIYRRGHSRACILWQNWHPLDLILRKVWKSVHLFWQLCNGDRFRCIHCFLNIMLI